MAAWSRSYSNPASVIARRKARHLELSAYFAVCDVDLVGAGQVSLADALGDVGQFLLGCLQEVLAFAGASGGQRLVAAGDQPFAGIVGVVALGEACRSNRLICNGPLSPVSFAIEGERSG